MSTYEADMEKAVRRVWKCLRCPQEEEPFTGQKFRVESHILRDHVENFDNSPFFCSLCGFCSLTLKELERHATHFKPHTIQREETMRMGTFVSDQHYQVINKNPKKFKPNVDYRMLTRAESANRIKTKTNRIPIPTVTVPSTSYLPTFEPFEDPSMDILLEVLEEQTKSHTVVDNQVVSITTTTTTTTMDNLIVDSTVTSNDVLQTPPDSPLVSTPLLSTPVRQVIIMDRQNPEQAAVTDDETDIMPQLLGNTDFHPSSDWDSVPINHQQEVPEDQSSLSSSTSSSSSSSSSTSSSSTSSSDSGCETCHTTMNSVLQAVQNLTKINQELQGTVKNLSSDIKILQTQITGLRSVVREQSEEIKTLKTVTRPVPPRFYQQPRFGHNSFSSRHHSAFSSPSNRKRSPIPTRLPRKRMESPRKQTTHKSPVKKPRHL